MASPIERRFIDPFKKTHRWRVVCSRCGHEETIGGNTNRPLPPQVIIKKLTRRGWALHHNNDKHDLCGDCVRRPIQNVLPLATKAMHDLAAPMVNGKMHFSELKAVCSTLGPEEARELIAILRERIPVKPKRDRPPPPHPATADTDYDEWLEQQEGPTQ